MKRNMLLYDTVTSFLPVGGILLNHGYQYDSPMVMEEDIDGDLRKEIIAAYQWYGNPYILILKYTNHRWIKQIDLAGQGYGVKDIQCAHITSGSGKDLIIGWKINEHWNELNVYTPQYSGLQRVIKGVQYTKIEIRSNTRNRKENQKDQLFIWRGEDNPPIKLEVTQGNEIQMKTEDSNHMHKPIGRFPASKSTIGGTIWGYINQMGKFVIKPQYDWAEEFQDNGLAVVDQKTKSGIINQSGKYIVTPQYDNIGNFYEERAVVMDGQNFKMINENGEVLFTTKGYLGNMENDRATLGITDKDHQWKYGYINNQGEVVIPPQFQSAGNFTNGKAVVQRQNGSYAVIDQGGNILQEYDYGYVGNISEGLLPFKKTESGAYGFIDLKGNIVIQPQYDSAQGFEQGRAIVAIEKDNIYKYGLINKKGEYIIPTQYSDIRLLGEQQAALGIPIDPEIPYQQFKYAIADLDGNILTDFIYRDVTNYENGYASVNDEKNTFFIDKRGKKVENLPMVRGAGTMNFVDDIIKANVDDRIAYLTKNGDVIWKQEQTVVLNEQYIVKEEKYKPNPNYLVYYPRISGMKDLQREKKVNQRLKELAGVKNIPSDKKLDYSYQGDFSVEFFRNHLVEIKLVGYNYPFGAAHGMPSQVYAHVDLHTGAFYQLPNLFKPGSNYVKIISDMIRKQIVNQEEYSYVWLDNYKGIEPDQPFFITENSLNIYFEPYEIAPYAAGFPTFTIPFAEIMNIINQRGAFWQSFH